MLKKYINKLFTKQSFTMSSVPSIRRLDEAVVNRIAAGEVIQRPFNALKELIENSLDANSTKIQITIKDGGLKLLQISDNGTGIRKEDLEIVCERFTTSKLSKFEDLSKISTYGFRGEALASISHVAHLTIVTKIADSQCGYRASYVDSKLKGPPKPCAVEKGTQIIVEDLFYNVPTRRNALKNTTEEYNKILDVVRKYSIHNYRTGFSLKKPGEGLSDVITPQNSTVIDNIRLNYGNSIAKELIEINSSDDTLKFQLYGQITNVNYSNKKLIFLLFINNRLVSSSAVKVMTEQVYSMYLPKNSYPFIYLSFSLASNNIDVNVHPTKHEVHFLHEDRIVDKVRSVLENALLGSNSSRVLYTQAKLPLTFANDVIETTNSDGTAEKKQYAYNTVRTDGSDQKIEKFFGSTTDGNEKLSSSNQNSAKSLEKRDVKLKSILQLRADVKNSLHTGLHNLIKNFVLVGFINPKQCLLQHETKLFLCNTENLVQEFLYQIMLNDFANFGVIRFSNPISIKELVLLYFEIKTSQWAETDGSKEDIASSMSELLVEKSAMLEDYFSIEIDKDGNIFSLPLVVEKYLPNIGLLPEFIVRLCKDVDWNLEKPCLDGICREITRFYAKIPVSDDEKNDLSTSSWKWVTEHILLSAMKSSLLPPNKFAQDGTILQIASLPDLYKVFERC